MEAYKDQFKPWVPNSFISEDVVVSADEIGASIVWCIMAEEVGELTQSTNLLYSGISVNAYLRAFMASGGRKEVNL